MVTQRVYTDRQGNTLTITYKITDENEAILKQIESWVKRNMEVADDTKCPMGYCPEQE